MKSKNTVFHAIYVVMLVLFIGIAVYLAAKDVSPSLAETEFGRTASFMTGWHTSDGTELDEKTLRKINTVSAEEFSIYNTLPDDPDGTDALFFRAKNVFYSVYIDGKLVYEPEFGESVFYTNSTGTRWNVIDLTPDNIGKEIEIRVRAAYTNARCGLDGFLIGSAGGAILNIIEGKLVPFITCVLLLFVGLLLAVADIPINMGKKKNHELLFLGLFSICVAVWCLAELYVVQFFFDNSRLMQVISCGSLMLIPMPLILYLDSAVGFKSKAIVPIVCVLSALEYTFCWGLHLVGIKDIHETLTLSHVMLAISAALLVYSFIKNAVAKSRQQGAKIYRVLRTVGLCSIAVAAFIDIARFYSGQTSDSATFTRIGLLIFTICYGSSSLENTIKAVKMGAQAEFVSRLAYHDGLTGIGNRTAFEERLDELEKTKSHDTAIGIVMFDVNDLKYVNDNLGHPLGDSMIRTAAEIISGAFEKVNGECFRIGGDEFAVILKGGDVKERYDAGMISFDEQTERHNSAPDCEFRISIAHGFFIYDSGCGLEHISDAYKMADQQMYETKREMKALQSSPEEYYAARRAKV